MQVTIDKAKKTAFVDELILKEVTNWIRNATQLGNLKTHFEQSRYKEQ